MFIDGCQWVHPWNSHDGTRRFARRTMALKGRSMSRNPGGRALDQAPRTAMDHLPDGRRCGEGRVTGQYKLQTARFNRTFFGAPIVIKRSRWASDRGRHSGGSTATHFARSRRAAGRPHAGMRETDRATSAIDGLRQHAQKLDSSTSAKELVG